MLGLKLSPQFLVQQGSVSLLYPWMELPYFAIPTTGLSVIVGEEVTMYGDALINVPISNDLRVTYTCDIGTQSGNNLVLNPVIGDIGDHELRITFKNGTRLITEETITLSVYEEAPSVSRKILIVGDSLMNSGITHYASQINSVLSNCTFTYLGTRGTTVKHEGYGGYRWETFVDGGGTYGDPFFIDGVLDIPQYFIDNAIDTPNYVKFDLGVNDVFGSSAVSGDGLSEAEITTIINFAKTLIDAFLAFDSNLKIILGLPTICTPSKEDWDYDYAPTYSQDLYINNIHKYREAFVGEFEEGVYNERVICSYESNYLNRANYANGVHPDATGYAELGKGMSFAINRWIKTDLKPTVLTSQWVDDYAQIDFTDNMGGTAQHEIWESKNDESYVLVETLAAGVTTYNNYTYQNASMKFKVRAKIGNWYSDYSDENSLSTPLVFKTDQSILTDVVITWLYINDGKTVNVDWGDGTNADYSGTNPSSIIKSYSVAQDPYYIQLSGDVNYINTFRHNNQALTYGDISKWVLPNSLIYLQISLTELYGDWSDQIIPVAFTNINIRTLGKLSGNLSNTTFAVGTTRFYAPSQDFTNLPRGNYKWFDSVIGLYAPTNICNTSEIDSILTDMADYFIDNIPINDSLFKFNGTGMGIPSAAGLVAKIAIETAYTNAGFTATIDVNS